MKAARFVPKLRRPPATKRVKGRTDPDAPRENRSRAVAELLPAIGGAAFRRFGFVQRRRSSPLARDRRRETGGREHPRIDPASRSARNVDGVLTPYQSAARTHR